MDQELKAIIDRGIAAGLSDDDIGLLVQEHQRRQAAALSKPKTESDIVDDLMYRNVGLMTPAEAAESGLRNTREHPIRTAAMLAAPAILGGAMRYGPPAVRTGATWVATQLDKPAVGSAIGASTGAYGGYKAGGATGAITGAVAGGLTGAAGTSKVADFLRRVGLANPSAGQRIAQGMSQATQAPTQSADDIMDEIIRRQVPDYQRPVSAPAAAPTAPASALQREVMARQGGPIDWRTTDAVPINAMKTKGIIEAGESIPGLADRAAVASKAGDAAEVERLLRAIRQRQHITAKAGR